MRADAVNRSAPEAAGPEAAGSEAEAPFRFEVSHRCSHSHARCGSFHTPHGVVDTPRFMPVGTLATVKGVTPEQLRATNAQMVLANTYHLHLQPGEQVVAEAGGLHRFMGWSGPLLTDSGGFQVFSLGAINTINDEGVVFRSPRDGARISLTPERSMEIQVALVLVCGISLSGGIHIDGVMDTADGLAAGERALEAMDDSRVGASGVVAFAQWLLLRAAGLFTLAELAPAPLVALALIWAAVWGRLAPLVAIQCFPYLRQASGGTAGFHRQHWRGLGRELLPSLPLLLLLALASGPVGLGGLGGLGLAPALAIPWLLGRRLGGHSGDTYGACVEWCEAVALGVMAVALALA